MRVSFSKNSPSRKKLQNFLSLIKAFINKIKVLSFHRKEPYFVLKNTLGFTPNTIEYYKLALLHRSSSVKNDKGISQDNERLEFLGDAILNSIVSDVLYNRFQDKKEGFLTNIRSKIVQRSSLDQLALELGLDKLIVSSSKNNLQRAFHINGNAFEALIGAIYLDQGYEKCKDFFEKKVLEQYIDIDKIVKKESNFKSKLLEWAQKRKFNATFVLTNVELDKESNLPVFYTKVVIETINVGNGVGNSKKESQQKAARNALKKMKKKDILDSITQKKEARIHEASISQSDSSTENQIKI